MLAGEEQRALEQARELARTRRKEVNRVRYIRYMRRRYPLFGLGRSADPMLHLQIFGSVVVSPRGRIVEERLVSASVPHTLRGRESGGRRRRSPAPGKLPRL